MGKEIIAIVGTVCCTHRCQEEGVPHPREGMCVHMRNTGIRRQRERGETSGKGLYCGFPGKEGERQNKQAYDWPVWIGSMDSWGRGDASSYLVPGCGVIRADSWWPGV